jgi:hypothetical protein
VSGVLPDYDSLRVTQPILRSTASIRKTKVTLKECVLLLAQPGAYSLHTRRVSDIPLAGAPYWDRPDTVHEIRSYAYIPFDYPMDHSVSESVAVC